MSRNIDTLACAPRYESSWTFTILGKSKCASEVLDEILGVAQKVLEINEGFFIPKKINYAILTYSEDFPANDVLDHKRLYGNERDIESDDKVTFKDLEEDVQSIKSKEVGLKRISRITIDGKTRFILKGGEEYIDINSPLELYAYYGHKGEKILDARPKMDPVYIKISHNFSGVENLSPEKYDFAFYDIVFWMETNIWFEKTEIGRANRNRLRNVFKKIYDNFEVVSILFMSDWYSEEALKNVAFGQD